jgi:DNA polymerase-3 subunit delta'
MTIQSLYESGRFPHAVLLLGETADEAVRLYKCDPADTVYVKESMPFNEKKTAQIYSIKPLREIIANGNYRPQFGDTRVFVFNEFDTMSEICQNSLLKFIEEPHKFNRFVMTAESKSKILPTILSRIVIVGHAALSVPDCEIAKNIVSALLRRDEYTAAAEFAKVKDRPMLTEVLQALLQELLNANQLRATDVVQKYIKRMEVNPNIPMAVSSCSAELYKEINN